MRSDPFAWLDYRSIADMALWAALLVVVLIYLWALAAGPVSAADPAPRVAPPPALKPVPQPDAAAALV